jgi:hypothetical protein
MAAPDDMIAKGFEHLDAVLAGHDWGLSSDSLVVQVGDHAEKLDDQAATIRKLESLLSGALEEMRLFRARVGTLEAQVAALREDLANLRAARTAPCYCLPTSSNSIPLNDSH